MADRIELRGLRVLGRHGALKGRAGHRPALRDRPRGRGRLSPRQRPRTTWQRRSTTRLWWKRRWRSSASTSSVCSRRSPGRSQTGILEIPEVQAVTVTVRKLRPPVAADMASAGVRLRRERTAQVRMSVETFLGLGSNMGDRLGYLELAVKVLQRHRSRPDGLAGLRDGPARWPGTAEQVPSIASSGSSPTLSAHQLLEVAHGLEDLTGRVRTVRNGPRQLDVDILLFGDLRDLRARSRGAAPADVRARVRAGTARGPRRVPCPGRAGATRLAEIDPASLDVRRVGTLR